MTNLTVEILRQIGTKLRANRVDNEYVLFVHPYVVQEWRYSTARRLYKLKSHNERYKRRYGEYPKEYKAEIVELEHFLFISRSKI